MVVTARGTVAAASELTAVDAPAESPLRSTGETAEEKASRDVAARLRRKMKERLREQNRPRRDRSQRSRPPREDERKRRAAQRQAKAARIAKPLAQPSAKTARIASRHLLSVTPAAAVYPHAQRGDAWLCSMCDKSFLISTSGGQLYRGHNQHKRSQMWHCTHIGCNHHECRSCDYSSALPRTPCVACTPAAKALPSLHSPPFVPLRVCI